MAAYIKTYTGLHIDPTNPDPDLINIEDIAHSLSLQCRGNGQVTQYFSVAQHCILCCEEAMARGLSKREVLACLIHDASEAYMSDVPRPFKQVLPDYNKYEEKLLDVIYTKYLGSPLTEEEAARIKEIDDDLLWFDLKYLLNEDTGIPEPKVSVEITYDFIPFEEVEKKYIALYNKVGLNL